MAGPGAFSWNSELPSGHNPFWIRDEGLAGLGLHEGDAVSVDTRAEPHDGDLVVAEADVAGDGDAQRLARRYFAAGDQVRLEPVSEEAGAIDVLELGPESVIIMGVIAGRLRFSSRGDPPIEEPLSAPPSSD
jgi:SOS-response transcriptional repressor LexA